MLRIYPNGLLENVTIEELTPWPLCWGLESLVELETLRFSRGKKRACPN
jgi:hypothetical protein